MSCCKDMRSVWGGGIGIGAGNASTGPTGGGGLITNLISAAGALSQLRLQTIFENVKPLQQALGSRHSGPIIVGGLATGVLLYCGHRWLSAANSSSSKQEDANGWKLKLKAAGGGDADGEDVVMGLETGHFKKLSPKEIEANGGNANVEVPLGLPEFEEVE